MELTEYRDRFPILADTTYLINHSLGAMPAAAEQRMLEFTRMWKERGIRAWGEGWWEMPMTVGDQVGRIIGAPPGSTVMHQNVAIAEAIIVSCFRPVDPRRNRVVYEEGNFPSVRYLYQAQPELDVVVVDDDRAIIDAIDERTLLVPITHVLFKTGEIQDVAAIVRRAHEVGAHVVLDAYQSAGIVPLDVAALNVDFAVGGSVKWLCGGPGNGWLYARPDLAEVLEPTFVGWQAHARPFSFEPELDFADGAARFLTGTPNVPALYAATAGYDLIEEIGVDRIRENSLRQTQVERFHFPHRAGPTWQPLVQLLRWHLSRPASATQRLRRGPPLFHTVCRLYPKRRAAKPGMSGRLSTRRNSNPRRPALVSYRWRPGQH